jgi:hypothetical protein
VKLYYAAYILILLIHAQSEISSASPKDDNTLKAELRGAEGVPTTLGPGPQSNFRFILSAADRDVRVFEAGNSWGHSSRSFELNFLSTKNSAEKKFKITRRPVGWFKNYPDTLEIKKNDVKGEEINLCDGTWKIKPLLNLEGSGFQLVGFYSVKEGNVSKEKSVWTGSIKTEPLMVSILKSCQNPLNK